MIRTGKGIWRPLALLLSASSLCAATPPRYEIQGIAVSSRDGAPVAFCRLSVEFAPSSTPAQPIVAPKANPNGRFGGAGRPGQRSGPPGTRAAPGPPQSAKNEVVADAAGRFTLELPQAGSWRLLGVARGFHSQIFEEHQGFYTAIVVTPDAPVFHTTFRMLPDAMITGVILDEGGEPVRTAQVFAERIAPALPGESGAVAGGPIRQVEAANTDDRGRYELAGLSAGNYVVRVQAQPWYASTAGIQRTPGVFGKVLGDSSGNPAAAAAGPTTDPSLDVVYPVTWFPAAASEAQAQPLLLAGGEERQADFHLSPIPAIHLQLPRQDPPASEPERLRQPRPATINRISIDGSGPSYGISLNNGSGGGTDWEFGGLTPGIYEVHLSSPNGQPDGETRQIEIRPGASGLLTLEASTPLTRVTVQGDGVPDSDIAAVEFVDTETGRRIASMPPQSRRGRRRASGEDDDGGDEEPGAGRLALLPPSTYDVVVTSRSDAYLSALDAIDAKATGTRVTISGGSPVLHLHMARGRGAVSGFALLPDRPAEGALVLLVPITLGTPGNTLPVLRDQANTDGSFLLTAVTPGKYILLAIDRAGTSCGRIRRAWSAICLKAPPSTSAPPVSLPKRSLPSCPEALDGQRMDCQVRKPLHSQFPEIPFPYSERCR